MMKLIELNIEDKVILENLMFKINNLIRIFQKYEIDEVCNLLPIFRKDS